MTITAQQIIDECPIIYRDFALGVPECYKGWLPLIHDLSVNIEAIVAKLDCPEEERPSVLQIKEKFGGLRFYLSNGTEEISNLIDKAEQKAWNICEICGSEDNVKTGGSGWIKTLCDGCD